MALVSPQQRHARVAAWLRHLAGQPSHREESALLQDLAAKPFRKERHEVADSDLDEEEEADANSSLFSLVRFTPHLPIAKLPSEHFAENVALEAPENLREALRSVIDVAMTAPGRCAFAVAPARAFYKIATTPGRDIQRADKGGAWRDGYMTTRLKGVRAQDPAFRQAVHEWSERTGDKCWPAGHEAEGLSKDGFTALVDTKGRCLRCAVYIQGLKAAPLRWDCVGSLHSTSLLLCWALRRVSVAVVVRSIAGFVHVIVPDGDLLKAFRCEL